MKEKCKNCKVSRSFEDKPLGPGGLKKLHPPADDIQRKLKESGQPDVLNCQQLFLKLSGSKVESLQKMFATDKNFGFISTIEEFILN